MKIFVYKWKAYGCESLTRTLQKMGHMVHSFACEGVVVDDQESQKKIMGEIRKKGFHMVISLNYFPVLAKVCKDLGLPYVSWTMDSPLLSLYDKSVYFETNYIFCFDYMQYVQLMERKIPHAFYLPLAADGETFSKAIQSITPEDKKRYEAEVSFVGRLYDSTINFSQLQGLPGYVKGYLEGVAQVQLMVPEVHFEKEFVPESFLKELKEYLHFSGGENSEAHFEMLVRELVDKEVTVLERRKMVQLLSRHTNFVLYTTSDTAQWPTIENRGKVDYYKEMPKVFTLSKINLNTTLRSILSGIPLRVLDILACGGFVLTNRQMEMAEYFEEDVSIVAYTGMDEMLDKINYYLKRDDLREKIAGRGYDIVREQFTYEVQVSKILNQILI